MAIKVLIADDDALIREGLKIILQTDSRFEVADCVENGLQAVQKCVESENSIDVALLDVRMPVMDGLQAAREIVLKTKVKPLILTTFDDDDFIFRALDSGARGYLLKNSSPGRIMDAINVVASGGTVMQDVVMDRIREELSSREGPGNAAGAGTVTGSGNAAGAGNANSGSQSPGFSEREFTDREMDVIRLIAKGCSNREIAGELFMSEGTIKNHITSILSKTGLDHRTQIAVYYLTGEKGRQD
ncbi:MAG: response regulator transcription factor [Clostridiales bacterium]|nr:response regulator transcription factor [Clostridiales bacterium]